ncbi:MAG: hypothetical protein IPH13_15005 [Planctomycetes bacterium]|nr:hypothetical protein [Planctomycetota bacterium]MCC7172187.1 hypothetical protein [Planctomycetota bacterium]
MKLPHIEPSKPISFGFGSEKSRLIFLGVLAVVFIAGFAYFHAKAQRDPAKKDEIADIRQEEAPFELVRQPAAKIDAKKLEATKDSTKLDRLVREPEPYTHLLSEAYKLTPGDLEVMGLRTLDLAALRRDPGLHRGTPFEVKGEVESIEVVSGDKYHEVRGRVRLPSDDVVAFAVLRESDCSPGDVVRLQGFFFKFVDLETAPGTWVENVPLLVGRALTRSYIDLAPNTSLEAVSWDLVRDHGLEDQIDLQEEILFEVLNYVRSLTPEQRSTLPSQEVTWADLRRNPNAFRGKIVQITAQCPVDYQWPRTLGPSGENPLDHRVFYDGIAGVMGERLFRWIAFEPLKKEDVGDLNVSHITGVFFKNVAWENKRGHTYNGPMIVPIRVVPFRSPADNTQSFLNWIVIGAVSLVVSMLAFSLFGNRNAQREFQRDFLARKKRQLTRVLEQKDRGVGEP